MKKVLFGSLGALILSLALIASPVRAVTNIASNGSFENGTDPGSFTTVNAGDSTTITGWTVNSGSVDYIGSYWQASDGSRSIDLDGNAQGSISQVLTTVSGDTYTVTFDLSGNPDGAPTVKTVQVGATGGTPQNFTYNTVANGTTHSNMAYKNQSYTFTANSASTTLTFASQDAGSYGAVLDNVVVADTTQACNANATQTLYSDATTQYSGGNSVVLTPNPAWTSISGASWVWGSSGSTENTTVPKTDDFTKTFNITGAPTSGSLVMSSDNGYVIKVNGHTVDSEDVDNANEFSYQTTHTYDVSSYLQTGSNTLEIDVTNFGRAGTTFANNPGGLIYSLTVGDNECTPPPSCQDTQSVAHIIYSDTTNTYSGTDGTGTAVVVTPTTITTADWTASIPSASWIWSTPAITNAAAPNTETFTKTFSISGTPLDSSVVNSCR